MLAADRVALAIENARVYEREHHIAETLQRSLLPERLPDVPGLDIAARYIPAAAEAEVGGDWYDVIPIPGGRVGLVMGDVAGKGLAAASMVGRMRSALRAYALEGHDPAVVIERLNRLLWTELEDSQMSTVALRRVRPRAGHDALGQRRTPAASRDQQRPHQLPGGRARGPARRDGVPNLRRHDRTLEPGSMVLLYTDGLVERPGSHLDVGMDRVAQEVAGVPADPEAVCDHLLATVVKEGPGSDDVALLPCTTRR